ncbi:NAD(P)-binding protein [Aspergillus ellipticus CBS 707.79]|uniref:NAD(P)-binding protein n=1 Tax=Aspergillus ellipticus CBS 707.79 TaxID=1448320 RepID=A0A319D533_9EURO|nr:NAD(P)-binding protein [Aspergillus ellipticus CBS 707.79]
MSPKPLLVVLGATDNQGGSVIAHFLSLSPSPYALRAVTRGTSSAKALSLTSQGGEVVAGNFDDPQSLDMAFTGASIIFNVTDFLQSMANPSLRGRAAVSGLRPGFYIRDYEAQHNRNIIDAAAKVTTLERFIYSSLPNMNKLSGGKQRTGSISIIGCSFAGHESHAAHRNGRDGPSNWRTRNPFA